MVRMAAIGEENGPSEMFVVVFVSFLSIQHKVHAGLAIQRTLGAGSDWERILSAVLGAGAAGFDLHVLGLFGDGIGLLFLGAEARELDELDACGTERVGPVDGALGMGDTAGDFVEEVGGRDWAVEGGGEVGGEGI